MTKESKTEQLQIRVSRAEKEAIRRAAKAAGVGISEWVLRQILRKSEESFSMLLRELASAKKPSYALASLNDYFSELSTIEFQAAVSKRPDVKLSSFLLNYLTAMIEEAAEKKGVTSPDWTSRVAALEVPHFGSELKSLRLHLLKTSPPSFRRRNIFIDSSIGDRV